MKIHVVFYSMYGHVYRMAEAVAEGARSVAGAEVSLLQAAELVPDAALERTGALEARKAFAHVPIADPKELAEVLVAGPRDRRFGAVGAPGEVLYRLLCLRHALAFHQWGRQVSA